VNTTSPEALVRGALYAVAPELEGEPLEPARRFRDQFDFDSMDFLRYAVELHRLTGLDIPERDYPQLETLAGAAAWLAEHLAAGGAAAR
jgi:acyl carrier protein